MGLISTVALAILKLQLHRAGNPMEILRDYLKQARDGRRSPTAFDPRESQLVEQVPDGAS